MTNEEIASLLQEIAELLEISGENVFRARAYLKASHVIRALDEPVFDLMDRGELEKLPGIGKSIASHLAELRETGKINLLEELRSSLPPSLTGLLRVPGIGPKTAMLIYKELGVTDVDGLREALDDGRLRRIKGLGAKNIAYLNQVFKFVSRETHRLLLPEAEEIFQRVSLTLRQALPDLAVLPAGSLRRRCDTIGDVDVFIQGSSTGKAFDVVKKLEFITRVVSEEPDHIAVEDSQNRQIELFTGGGTEMLWATGSSAHVEALKKLADRHGFNLSRNDLIREGKKVEVASDADVYEALGLAYIPPELRENRGELEAARLPRLIERGDIKGDVHVHSTWSDSSATIEEIAEICREMGYEYVVVADHARRLKVARGMGEKEIKDRLEEINEINRRYAGEFYVFSGVELNIDKDGLLDCPDEVLAGFDFCVASIHWGMQSENILKRIEAAMRNPYVDAIGHPTGRILGKRPPMDIDYERLIELAVETGTFIEINAFPDRLDLPDYYVKKARDAGAKLVIGTDAHALNHLAYMKYGVDVARRGWLEKTDVINTLGALEFIQAVRKRRERR